MLWPGRCGQKFDVDGVIGVRQSHHEWWTLQPRMLIGLAKMVPRDSGGRARTLRG